ncbi:nuclear transport factor 2 family protein [Candidatus Accumulibacter contiguus]|jgi:steroid delta-isomerase|uniref:Nuclear transport factor 2 family protein n=1 Tax=Candidatus Accumulibacter contiguus TaxID=2954381 RepID=A0ABX1T4T6_9PROT|nr:nuclear transport factor 2 family protein [Candidatus Accumulibacter contiguus]
MAGISHCFAALPEAEVNVDELVCFYHELSLESVARLPEFYSRDAWFKDPFNEVRGVAALQRIFEHMFRQVAEPRFVITEQVVAENGAMLVWEFFYRVRLWGKGEVQVMRGVSHLQFDDQGKVCYHRDYWDTGEELYMKLPVLGTLMRGLRRALAA